MDLKVIMNYETGKRYIKFKVCNLKYYGIKE